MSDLGESASRIKDTEIQSGNFAPGDLLLKGLRDKSGELFQEGFYVYLGKVEGEEGVSELLEVVVKDYPSRANPEGLLKSSGIRFQIRTEELRKDNIDSSGGKQHWQLPDEGVFSVALNDFERRGTKREFSNFDAVMESLKSEMLSRGIKDGENLALTQTRLDTIKGKFLPQA